jgi:molybdenum ABC transporter molybdate-binding protein
MMSISKRRAGAANYVYVMAIGSLALLAILFFFLFRGGRPNVSRAGGAPEKLFVFCAAGLRAPIEKIADQYEKEYGVSVQLQYGGSATLLSQIEVSNTGDLYLAGDDSYAELAHEKGLVEEQIPLAKVRPVLAVKKGNPKNIQSLDDLLRKDVRVALGNPDQAAIGQTTRRLLGDAGRWAAIEARVADTGVFKPTVPEVANDVKLGSVDVGIIWDSTVAQYPELEAVRVPELDPGTAEITIGVLASAKNPTAALRLARYMAARDRGLLVFRDTGYEPVDGDVWAEVPEMTFFAGSVNRKALEPIIEKFQQREGVAINTVYNGCGILTGQMRSIQKDQQSGFPDVYMACDVYYLNNVRDLFQEAADVSNTDIVIVVAEGNPKGIKTLDDLLKPGVRVAIGQPDQCTIGALTRNLLEDAGIYDRLLAENVVTQTATSAMLVPAVTTRAADAVLAYVTDTKAEGEKIDAVPIDSPLAKAVQPFSVARSSDHKYLGRRLFQTIARSRDSFEAAGFRWGLDDRGLVPLEAEGEKSAGQDEK